MGFNEANAQLETTGMEPSPYIRVNRSSSLSLTTTFQRLDFDGTSTRNTNLFPVMSGGSRLVQWDSVNKVFKFNGSSLRHYDIQMNLKILSAGLINSLNLNVATVRLRFVVPSPTPRYFPFPDESSQYVDVATTNMTAERRVTFDYLVRAADDVRQYGLGIDICVSNTSLLPGAVSLGSVDLSCYGR